MHHPKIILAVLLAPAALAVPGTGRGYGHGHLHHGHKPHQSGFISGAPFASGTGGAPYSLGNGSSSAAGTGTGTSTNYLTTTIQSTIYQALPSDSGAPIESATVAAKFHLTSAGSCDAPVIVTYNPTVTVTVTSNAAPAESATESSALVVSVSATPIASPVTSSAISETIASVTPASSEHVSVTPVVSSVAAAPETSEAPQPTQATSSASIVASAPATSEAPPSTETPIHLTVAPVQTSSAAPLNPASSTAVTPPVASAPASDDVDWCKDILPFDDLVTPLAKQWTGANYTGGVKGQKKGLVWVAGTDDAPQLTKYINGAVGNIHWVGNYFSGAPDGLADGIEFVPQMYGLKSEQYWNQNALTAEQKGWKHLFSFGEPGTPNAELFQDPPTGASNYLKWMNNYTEVMSVGAPGNLEGVQDFKWDQQFLCECSKLACKVDFLAVHWFGWPYDKPEAQWQNFTRTIENYINVARGKPIWVDNVWAAGNESIQMEFMDAAIPYLENNPAVIRYGWVPQNKQDHGEGPDFVMPDGTITPVGQHYLDAKGDAYTGTTFV